MAKEILILLAVAWASGALVIAGKAATFPFGIVQALGAGLIPWAVGIALLFWRRSSANRLKFAAITIIALCVIAAIGRRYSS